MIGKLTPRASFFLGGLIGVGVFFVSLSVALAATEDVTVNATVPAICGNGTVEGSEECDDGNTTDGDSCSASCVIEADDGGPQPPPPPPAALCGNGVVETGEQCDDGNQVSGDGCTGSCQLESQPAMCGNGVTEGAEQCDDGNTTSGDGCSSSCLLEGPMCGNGILENGEQCEDGNTVSGDGCSATCQIEFPPAECGNGDIEGAEQCDDGNTQSGDGCSASCVIEDAGPACGNGVVEGAEQCDDGNLQNGDGCSSSCQTEVILGPTCGNGLVEEGEQCDDNNTTNGDGCSASCQNEAPSEPGEPGEPTEPGEPGEPGGPGPGGAAPGICGNAIVEANEQCDDGNTVSGDGCSRSCRLETVTESVQETIDDIRDIISGEGSIAERTGQVIDRAADQLVNVVGPAVVRQTQEAVDTVQRGAERVNEFANNPEVERVTKDVVAPSVVITAAAAVAPSLFNILFPLLRFLFLQPVLIFGKRKRKEWGMVYNALDKTPVDLAIVRLLDAKTGKVVRSRVTDKEGRYLFSVPAGEYRIEVTKQGFNFPSELLKQVSADGRLLDLYHGEEIVVTEEETRITPNIPLDPKEAEAKTPSRILWEGRLRVLQHAISLAGIIATAVSLYVNPAWEIWLFLGMHIALYLLFLRFVRPKKPDDWGIVYDIEDKAPVGRAVARLFSKQYDKLVATKVTDTKGRYAFLAGPNDYYVMVEKPGYDTVTKDISIKDKEGAVNESLGIQKHNKAKKQEKQPDAQSPEQAVTPQEKETSNAVPGEKKEETQKQPPPSGDDAPTSTPQVPPEKEKPETLPEQNLDQKK